MTPQERARTRRSWYSAKARCRDPNDLGFSRYGGRGILFHPSWDDFEQFASDMGIRPIGKSLDRINVNGHYEPNNCRWATAKEQQRNRRDNVRYEHQGLSLTLPEWAERAGLSFELVKKRVTKLNWPLATALASPPGTWSPVRLSKGRNFDHWQSVILSTPSNKAAAEVLGTTPKTVCHWRRRHCGKQRKAGARLADPVRSMPEGDWA